MADLTLAVAQSVVTSDLAENVEAHVRLASIAADHGAQLVVFPELSLTGYSRGLTSRDANAAGGQPLTPLQEVADARDVVVQVGVPVVSAKGLHIGTLSFRPRQAVTTYLKQHLHAGEESAFLPGNGGAQLQLGKDRIACAICADVTHPEHVAAAVLEGATVYAASCFLTEAGHEVDTELLEGYARGHQVVVLMANYGCPVGGWSSAGKSAIWSADGSLLACAPAAGEAVVVAAAAPDGWAATVAMPPDGQSTMASNPNTRRS